MITHSIISTVPKLEEKQLAGPSVSEHITSGSQRSLRTLTAPTLSKPSSAHLIRVLLMHCVAPSPSASPMSDRDKQQSPIKIISKTSETNVLLDSPRPRAVPMLPMPIAMPAHTPQAPSVPPSTKAIP
jgi:hypothetical protein